MQENKLNKRLSIELSARIKRVSYPQLFLKLALAKYLRILGGALLAITLLVPVIWTPGLVILVLPSEVYLLDWIHTQYAESHIKQSIFDQSSESDFDFVEAEQKRTTLLQDRQSQFTR
ncbi:MAG: hypothetical protein ACFFDV_04720 [Candidatus Thorarchaeota archaeon]